MWFIIGTFVGFWIGMISMGAAWTNHDKRAVKNGYISLDGKLYLLEEAPKPKNYLKKEEE